MRADLKIRKVRTSSGATAVQIVRYVNRKRVIVRHIGSAHTDQEFEILFKEAQCVRDELSLQLSLFPVKRDETSLLHEKHLYLQSVTHVFAHQMLRRCGQICGLAGMHPLYQDLAVMRIIEPASKLRTIELLQRYFNISYSERTVYRLLPELIHQKSMIETAAYQTACTHFGEVFALVLYDVTTLYFESHEPDDDLRAKGFSKDNKSQQPQIVVGLLVTSQGFPLMHEVYKGNTFEGHTMLGVLQQFKEQYPQAAPIIVADAAMLSKDNMDCLQAQGYQYIVGARLANATPSFIHQIHTHLAKTDGACIRLNYPKHSYEVICSYSEKRARKDRRELDKQLSRAKDLIERKESGSRAKFIKKNLKGTDCFVLNEQLKEKAEKLLGIKGYITNVPETVLSNDQVIQHYHDLWHVEQAFRVSKMDLRTRPIFHHTHQAIRAHVLLCFMALIMSKFLEIKSGLSISRIRDILWSVHEVHITDKLTNKAITLQTNLHDFKGTSLAKILLSH